MADNAELTERRARLLGPNVATFYDEPVHIVRGQGVWLWDAEGRKYLDCYNNTSIVTITSPMSAMPTSGWSKPSDPRPQR